MSALRKGNWARGQFFLFLAVTAFVILFSGIYEIFSHQVMSWWMILAAGPFLAGAACWFVFYKTGLFQTPCRPFQICFMMATVSCTLGMVVRGVLEIYGTWSSLVHSYDILFGVFFFGSVLSLILYLHYRRKAKAE